MQVHILPESTKPVRCRPKSIGGFMPSDLHVVNGEAKEEIPPVPRKDYPLSLLSEVLVSNPLFTLNLKSTGEISLTIRTDSEDELERLLKRWESTVIVYPDLDNEQRRYFAGDTCPECSNKLVRKQGKRGKFLGCLSFPDCKFSQSL